MMKRLVLFLVCAMFALASQANQASSAKYRGDLIRIAHATWGLDAPVPVFAAQIHQESGWNTAAVSRVGALGMAQFMPATARWWCTLNKLSLGNCQPSNPIWAMRAMIGYDQWLYQRVAATSEYDRIWATLRAYNGGLGHWQREAMLARPSQQRQDIDLQCGQASRSVKHCPENLGYPDRILNRLQPLYAGWGPVVGGR